MPYDIDSSGRRIPTLVQYCQRVACAHVDNICSLGGGLRYDLIRPVLENCTPDTLLRFEENDPYIAKGSSDIWKGLLMKEFPIAAHQYESNAVEEPESWRDELFALRATERRRLDELSARLKASRQEEEERKKESAIKITDKLPPAKRARPWGVGGGPSQPKTLFQKTKSDTARLQKGVFGTRYVRPAFQTQRIISHTASAKPPPPPSVGSSGSRVVVKSIPVVQNSPPPKQLPKKPPGTPTRTASALKTTVSSGAASPPPPHSSPPPPPPPSSPPDTTPSIVRGSSKKDTVSSLFMPKHRAYSQVPRGVKSKS